MKPSRKSVLYFAYIIGIGVFFLYVLFPSDTVTAYLAYQLSEGDPDFTVTIEHVSPVLPPGIKLHAVNLFHQDTALVALESLKIMPGLLSLFSSTSRINFKGRLYAGKLSGRVELNDDQEGSQVKVDGQISGAQVQKIAALRQFSAHKMVGRLGADFAYTDTGPDRSLTAKLTVTDGRVEFATPVFSLKSLDFNDIDADLTLKNERLIIKQCNLKGNQLDASISGTIVLNANGGRGRNALNLTGTMKPHHVLLAKIEKSLPGNFLRRIKAGKASISFRIGGTLEEPGFSLK